MAFLAMMYSFESMEYLNVWNMDISLKQRLQSNNQPAHGQLLLTENMQPLGK